MMLSDRLSAGAEAQDTAICHCIPRIHAEIQYRHLKLIGVCSGWRQMIANVNNYFDPGAHGA
jgi:hypothetical protein